MPFLTQGKTNWKFIGIVAVLAIIVIFGISAYCQLLKKELEITPIEIPKQFIEDETVDWLTYRNGDLGFELKYLKEWTPIEIIDGLQRQSLYHFQTPDGEIGFSVGGYPYAGSLNEYFETQRQILSNAEGANYILSEIKEIIIDGQNAIEIPNRIGENYEERLIFIKHNNFIYRITLTTKNIGDNILNFASVDAEKAKILSQILSTFRFIEETSYSFKVVKGGDLAKQKYPDFSIEIYKNGNIVKIIDLGEHHDVSDLVLSPDQKYAAFKISGAGGTCVLMETLRLIDLSDYSVIQLDESAIDRKLSNVIGQDVNSLIKFSPVPKIINDFKWVSNEKIEADMQFGNEEWTCCISWVDKPDDTLCEIRTKVEFVINN